MRHQGLYKNGPWEWRHDCPSCEHADDQHRVCRECNHEGHSLCMGLTQSSKSPLVYVPCHCSWIPGTPREVEPAFPILPEPFCDMCDSSVEYCNCPEFSHLEVPKP